MVNLVPAFGQERRVRAIASQAALRGASIVGMFADSAAVQTSIKKSRPSSRQTGTPRTLCLASNLVVHPKSASVWVIVRQLVPYRAMAEPG